MAVIDSIDAFRRILELLSGRSTGCKFLPLSRRQKRRLILRAFYVLPLTCAEKERDRVLQSPEKCISLTQRCHNRVRKREGEEFFATAFRAFLVSFRSAPSLPRHSSACLYSTRWPIWAWFTISSWGLKGCLKATGYLGASAFFSFGF